MLTEIVRVTLTVFVAQTVGKVLEGVRLVVREPVLVREIVCVLLLVRVTERVLEIEMVRVTLVLVERVCREEGGIVAAVV
jgi:hypothetical protein